MTDSNGSRWRMSPAVLVVVLGWAIQLGMNIGYLNSLSQRVEKIENLLSTNVHTRSESDAIIARVDLAIRELEARSVENRDRIIALERKLR